MKYLSLLIIFLASVVTHGATLNGVLYDSATKDLKPSSNVLVGTFSSVSSVTLRAGTATLTNALTVPNGGSGVATLALNGVLYGNGAGAIQALPVNSTATTKFLSQVSSGAPVWSVPAFGSGTAGVNLRWASGGVTAEDGYFIDGSGFTVPRTNNAITFGSTTNRLAGVNSVNVNFSGQLTSTVASGTPPLIIASGTEVAMLNVQYWGGKTLDYLNVGFILGDTMYWNGSGNPTRLLPNQNTNIAFYVQYGTGGTYPDLAVAPFWMQVTAGSNISISRSSLTNFTINASTAAGVAVGTGTTGTYTKWSNGSGGLTDGALAASSVTNATLTGNILANGSVFTNGITDVSKTLGSVLFAGTGGVQSQDNANLFWDDTNNYLGIGTNGPAASIDVFGTNTLLRLTHNANQADGLVFRGTVTNSGSPRFFFVDSAGSGNVLFRRTQGFSISTGGVVGSTSGANRFLVTDAGNVLVGSLTSNGGQFEVLSTTEQLRLSYDSTHYASFTENSSGNLTIVPSGGTANVTGALVVSGTVTASAYIESGASFGITSDATVANTAAETTLLGTAGLGSKTLSANVLTVGRTLHGVLRGRYSSAAIAGTLRIKVKFGSTVILDTAAQTMPNASSGKIFDIDYDITCRTTGGTGTIFAQGKVLIGDVTGLVPQVLPMVNTTTSTIDTTATQVLDVTATWGTADAGNTVTGSVGSLQ